MTRTPARRSTRGPVMLLAGLLLVVNLLCAVHAYDQSSHPGDGLCELCVHATMLGHALGAEFAGIPCVRTASSAPAPRPRPAGDARVRRPRARSPPV